MYNNAVKQQELAIKEIKTLSNTNDPNIVKSDLSLCGARSDLYFELLPFIVFT
jgi:hypothetical protein